MAVAILPAIDAIRTKAKNLKGLEIEQPRFKNVLTNIIAQMNESTEQHFRVHFTVSDPDVFIEECRKWAEKKKLDYSYDTFIETFWDTPDNVVSN